jgi:hypothetical protein
MPLRYMNRRNSHITNVKDLSTVESHVARDVLVFVYMEDLQYAINVA